MPINWSGCDLVESIPGKQGGVPLVKDTRIPAEQIIEEHELGSSVEEIAENYPSLPQDKIHRLLVFAERQLHPVS